jgi:hypothetical protein
VHLTGVHLIGVKDVTASWGAIISKEEYDVWLS